MPTMDPSLFSVLKQQLPDLSDQDVVLAHQTIANRLKAQGQDFDALPIPQQAQLYKSVISELKTAQSNVDPNVQSVSIVGQRPVETPDQEIQKMPAAPQAPQLGASQLDALYQGNGPTAARLNAIDPTAYQAAVQDFARRQHIGNPVDRFLGRFAASVRDGIGGQAGAFQEYNKFLADQDREVTTGAAKTAADMANQGLGAANSALGAVSSANVAQGNLDMAKRKFILDQSLLGMTVEQAEKAWDTQQKLYDPTSQQSKATIAAAAPILKSFGVDPRLLSGMTAADVATVVGNLKPTTELQDQLVKQFLTNKQLGIAGFNAQTTRMGTVSENAARDLGTRIGLAVTGAVPGAKPEDIKANLGGAGYNWAGAGLTPSPATTGTQTGAAARVNSLGDAATAFETSGAGRSAQSALTSLGNARYLDTGKFGSYLARVPGTDAAGIRSSIASYYTSKGLTPQAAQQEADAIFNLSPRQGAIRMAQIVADGEVLKQQLVDQSTALKAGGNLAGYVPKSYVTFYNPKTGDVVIGDSQKDKPAGYISLSGAK